LPFFRVSNNTTGTTNQPSLTLVCQQVPGALCIATNYYDFLLPRDQIIGLLLDNSLDVEMQNRYTSHHGPNISAGFPTCISCALWQNALKSWKTNRNGRGCSAKASFDCWGGDWCCYQDECKVIGLDSFLSTLSEKDQNNGMPIVFAFDFMRLTPKTVNLAAKLTPAMRLCTQNQMMEM
jgi:hypothetical protein